MKDQLAQRIRLGDEQAFELLFRKYYIRLCGFANKFLNDPDLAQEVTQEAFYRLWDKRNSINPEGSIKSYLFMIVQNLCLNLLKRKKVESGYERIYKMIYVDHNEFSAHESLLASELEERIAQSIENLPDRCKRIFRLHRFEGLSYFQIGQVLNISVKTVETQISKALTILRIELKDYLILPLLFLITK